MPYVEDVVEPLIKTLEHTAGLPAHQLAGHAANLGFWVAEVVHAIEVIDGYPDRFDRLRKGQRDYAGARWDPNVPGPPLRPGTPDHQLRELRRRVGAAAVRVLRRCHKEGLVGDEDLEEFSRALSLTPDDVRRGR